MWGRGSAQAARGFRMLALLAAAGVCLAASAMACTPNAFIDTDGAAPPGGTVSGRGAGFGPAGNMPGVTAVELHLQTAEGAELGTVWSGLSGADGRFSFSFRAPEQAGYYVLAAIRPGREGAVSNNLQVGSPEAAEPGATPAPGQPVAPPAASPAPSAGPAPSVGPAPSAGPPPANGRAGVPSPNGSGTPAGDEVGARRQVLAGASSPTAPSVRGAAQDSAPALKGLGALQPKDDAAARQAAGRRGRAPSARRETSIAAPEGSQGSSAATAAGTGSGASVWLGLALIGAGLAAVLTVGAALLGGLESPRWSLALRRRLRRRR